MEVLVGVLTSPSCPTPTPIHAIVSALLRAPFLFLQAQEWQLTYLCSPSAGIENEWYILDG